MARHKVTNITKYWKIIQKKIADRTNKLNETMPLVREYHESMTTFLPWLTTAEKSLQALVIGKKNQHDLAEQRAEIKVSRLLKHVTYLELK